MFVSHHFKLVQLRRLPNGGSDHFLILVSLIYQPDPNRTSELPEPEGNDLEESKEIIRRAEKD